MSTNGLKSLSNIVLVLFKNLSGTYVCEKNCIFWNMILSGKRARGGIWDLLFCCLWFHIRTFYNIALSKASIIRVSCRSMWWQNGRDNSKDTYDAKYSSRGLNPIHHDIFSHWIIMSELIINSILVKQVKNSLSIFMSCLLGLVVDQ